MFDRVLGKPKQDIGVSGGITHFHTRDPLLASLPKEAVEALARAYDDVLARFALPVADASQDGPQNQKESKPPLLLSGDETMSNTSNALEGFAC